MRNVATVAALSVLIAGAVTFWRGAGQANMTSPETASAERVAPGSLQCDFDGYEGIANYEEASKGEREVYALGMGYANRGSKKAHEALRKKFGELRFDPQRAPIVLADLDTARLHVFDCEGASCTRAEIAQEAPRACAEVLDTSSCMIFAVRVKQKYYCTLGPGLNE